MRPRSWRRLPSLSLRPERGAENVVSTGIIAPFPAAASRNGLGNSAGAWGSPYRESVPGQRRSTRNACPNVSSSLDSRRNRCSAEGFRDVSFDSGGQVQQFPRCSVHHIDGVGAFFRSLLQRRAKDRFQTTFPSSRAVSV